MSGAAVEQVLEKWVVRLKTAAGGKQEFFCPSEQVARAFVARLEGTRLARTRTPAVARVEPAD